MKILDQVFNSLNGPHRLMIEVQDGRAVLYVDGSEEILIENGTDFVVEIDATYDRIPVRISIERLAPRVKDTQNSSPESQ